MLITIKNIIGSIRNVLGIVTDGLKMWLPFERSDILGEEVIVNGDFAIASGTGLGWTASGGATTTGGVGFLASSPASSLVQNNLVSGKTYYFSIEAKTDSSGNIKISNNGVNFFTNTSLSSSFTTFTGFFTANANDLTIGETGSGGIYVDNVSVKEVNQFAPDTSGNSNNATLYTGKALSFDGVNDYVDLGNVGDIFSSNFTIAMWVKPSTISSRQNLFSQREDAINWWRWSIDGAGQWEIDVEDNDVRTISSNPTSTLSIDNWQRILLVKDGNNWLFYRDGEADGSFVSSATIPSLDAPVWLGAISGEYSEIEMSDFQIYDTPWTQADVTYDYNKPNHLVTDNPSTSIALSNLKGYWALSEGDGAIAYDSSGEANDGTINGATYVDQQATIPQLGMMDWSKGSNLYLNSEPTSDEGSASNITYAAYSWNYRQFDNATVFGDNSAVRYRYGGTVSPSTETTLSAFVIMDDNSEPNISNSGGSGDFSIVLKGTISSGVNSKTNVSGNIWKISKTATTTSGSSLTTNNGIIKYSTQSSKGFRVVGWQLEESSSPTAYRRTNGTAVTDVTLISSPNNPSQDILGNPVRLREHSFNLDGSGYAEVADDSSLDFGTGDFSLECWVKYDFLNQGSSFNVILSNGNISSTGGSGFSLATRSSDFTVRLNAGSAQTITFGSGLTQGQWYHIVFTRSGTAFKAYLDKSLTTSTKALVDVDTSLPVRIGRDTTTTRYYINLIDDVRLYNKALSAEEVEQNYKVGEVSHKTGSSFSDDFSGDYGN